jgi:uncharacterized protein (TIGR00730 family)
MSKQTPLETSNQFVSLADEEGVKQILVDTILRLWETVNNLTRLRVSKREHYHVTIFGSARAQPGSYVYEEVRRLSRELSAMDCKIVTGGGPGLMQAANQGASEANNSDEARSLGINIQLPFEQEVNPFVDQAFEHQTFFTRLHHFVLLSDAFIVVPGGIGTVLETLMIWQLLQVRQVQNMPLILIGKMWPELLEWMKTHMLRPELALVKPEDLSIPRCVNTADEAIALLREDHARWRREQTR